MTVGAGQVPWIGSDTWLLVPTWLPNPREHLLKGPGNAGVLPRPHLFSCSSVVLLASAGAWKGKGLPSSTHPSTSLEHFCW